MDAPHGLDTPLPLPPLIAWNDINVGHLVPISLPSPDEAKEDEAPENHDTCRDGTMNTWHDVALSIAAELMGKARETVRTRLGYSTSAVSSYLYLPSMLGVTKITTYAGHCKE
jgi:DNA polymerase eta